MASGDTARFRCAHDEEPDGVGSSHDEDHKCDFFDRMVDVPVCDAAIILYD